MGKQTAADISNIAAFNKQKSKPKLKNIDLFFQTIPQGVEVIAIADRSLYHQIDEQKRFKNEYLRTRKVLEAPANVSADIFILKYAQKHNCPIISNDRFLEYEFVDANWVKNHRITFMIIRNQFFFQVSLSKSSRKGSTQVSEQAHHMEKYLLEEGI